ncbi:MAG: carboxylating nicotinate-nucleotide diphosphorylase [Candidatus Hydrogenedentes bacterium]|nr:carboxylating nicotinate-nucleotide diphosphorylase [Candidatus Hydrogenedentota bacterium]
MLGLDSVIRDALLEDIGRGDVTTEATVPEDARCRARLYAKQDGVLSGIGVFRAVFHQLNAGVSEWRALENGARFSKGQDIATFEGGTRAVLSGERVALNFLQRLSGVATLTAALVAKVNGLSVRICDTRKTTPLLRQFEKDAVRHGGGSNHRFALYDGILIKENHITAAGGVKNAVLAAIDKSHHLMSVGVEVRTMAELAEAIGAGADVALLDNMTIEQMREAVALAKGKPIVLEASGNVTLDTVRAIAETGVHIISVGALTHSAPAIDLSLEITNA